jgi:D-glycero-beta-D-manno-heptose-7-phosphate kinase
VLFADVCDAVIPFRAAKGETIVAPFRQVSRGARLSSARKTKRVAAAKSGDASVDLARLLDIVAAFSRQTICVAGDLVLDEFVSTEISRVSREAPVLILRHRRTESFPGGAANAINNLADLGARVLPVGVVGEDEGGRALLEHLRRKRIDTSRIIRVRDWVTTTKTRTLAGWTHTTEQQVLRVDREPSAPLPARVQEALANKVRAVARRASAVLVSDYGLGAATPSLVRGLRAKQVALDSRFRLLEYAGTGVTAATPNEAELEAAYGEKIGTDRAKLEELGRRAMDELTLASLVVTRGKDGLAVFERDAGAQPVVRHIPIFGTDAPVDVAGAGDTVIAVFTLSLAAGATPLEAAHLANYAGGIVVMKRRTATVTRAELQAAIEGR